MNIVSSPNPCTRCGQPRIVAKSWTETIQTYVGTSTIIHRLTVCPNEACQAYVDAEIAANKERAALVLLDKQARDAKREEQRRQGIVSRATA